MSEHPFDSGDYYDYHDAILRQIIGSIEQGVSETTKWATQVGRGSDVTVGPPRPPLEDLLLLGAQSGIQLTPSQEEADPQEQEFLGSLAAQEIGDLDIEMTGLTHANLLGSMNMPLSEQVVRNAAAAGSAYDTALWRANAFQTELDTTIFVSTTTLLGAVGYAKADRYAVELHDNGIKRLLILNTVQTSEGTTEFVSARESILPSGNNLLTEAFLAFEDDIGVTTRILSGGFEDEADLDHLLNALTPNPAIRVGLQGLYAELRNTALTVWNACQTDLDHNGMPNNVALQHFWLALNQIDTTS